MEIAKIIYPNTVIHELSDEYVRALIIGHNPGLEELVEMLTGEIHLMPTCSLAHV
jgi:phosphohistidine phosphatase SixA